MRQAFVPQEYFLASLTARAVADRFFKMFCKKHLTLQKLCDILYVSEANHLGRNGTQHFTRLKVLQGNGFYIDGLGLILVPMHAFIPILVVRNIPIRGKRHAGAIALLKVGNEPITRDLVERGSLLTRDDPTGHQNSDKQCTNKLTSFHAPQSIAQYSLIVKNKIRRPVWVYAINLKGMRNSLDIG